MNDMRPAHLDFCDHGYFVGDEPTICRELAADDEWNEANPPLVGHLGIEQPAPVAVVSRYDAPVIQTILVPAIHASDGGAVAVIAPQSPTFRCEACGQRYRQIVVVA